MKFKGTVDFGLHRIQLLSDDWLTSDSETQIALLEVSKEVD